MVGGYTPPTASQPFYYTRQGEEWQAWDGQLSTLAVAEEIEQLPEQQKIVVYQGNFSGILGDFVCLRELSCLMDNERFIFGWNKFLPI
ncbi:MAG: hypothetical protein BWK79_14360 [Beggiatoa sp. IS2]|nr:MAG: hypothetical protein BWK79_14360 [Beggiatoa sp. IS2]